MFTICRKIKELIGAIKSRKLTLCMLRTCKTFSDLHLYINQTPAGNSPSTKDRIPTTNFTFNFAFSGYQQLKLTSNQGDQRVCFFFICLRFYVPLDNLLSLLKFGDVPKLWNQSHPLLKHNVVVFVYYQHFSIYIAQMRINEPLIRSFHKK